MPVISAVGHETDFTICDFVADMRAPTPSAAAELAVPDIRELFVAVDNMLDRSDRALNRALERARERLLRISESRALGDFSSLISAISEKVNILEKNASSAYSAILGDKKLSFISDVAKLEALNPLSVMSRGYSIVEKNGKSFSTVGSVETGDVITVRLHDGSVDATVKSKTFSKGNENE